MAEHCGTENRWNPPMPGLDGVRVEERRRGLGLDLVPRHYPNVRAGADGSLRQSAAAHKNAVYADPWPAECSQCETVGKTGHRAVGEQLRT